MQSREKMNIDLTPILNHRSSWRKSPVFELLAGGLDGDKELPGYPYSTLEEEGTCALVLSVLRADHGSRVASA